MAIDNSLFNQEGPDSLSVLDSIIDAAGDFDSDDDRFVVTLLRESIVSPSNTPNLHVKRLLVNSRAVLLKHGASEEQYRVIFDGFISKMQSYQRLYFESEVFNEKR